MKQTLDIGNIGSARDILKGKESSPLVQFIQGNLQELIVEIRAKGGEMGVLASRNLVQSFGIKEPIEANEQGVNATIVADDYWKFVNYGVNGTLNTTAPNWKALGYSMGSMAEFVKKIEQWMPFRNIKPLGKETMTERAEGIAFGILKRGKVARPFVTETIKETKVFKEMAKGIGEMLGKAVAINIKHNLQNGNNIN
jgi:hypothetical protein